MKTTVLTALSVAAMLGTVPTPPRMLPPKRKGEQRPGRLDALAALRWAAEQADPRVGCDSPLSNRLREAQKRGWVILKGADPIRVTITKAGRAALA